MKKLLIVSIALLTCGQVFAAKKKEEPARNIYFVGKGRNNITLKRTFNTKFNTKTRSSDGPFTNFEVPANGIFKMTKADFGNNDGMVVLCDGGKGGCDVVILASKHLDAPTVIEVYKGPRDSTIIKKLGTLQVTELYPQLK